MRSRELWPDDPILIEIGVTDANVALGLREQGYQKYLGVSGNARRIADLRDQHPAIAGQFTCSKRPKLVLNNNADVLILSGAATLSFWRFQWVRHAQSVAWRWGFHPLSLLALVCCLLHAIAGRCKRPRIVKLNLPGGKCRRLFATRVLRQKNCFRKSLHFIPHVSGLLGLFQQFDKQAVKYVVLRWFESLPEIGPNEDVDLLVSDESLPKVLEILARAAGHPALRSVQRERPGPVAVSRYAVLSAAHCPADSRFGGAVQESLLGARPLGLLSQPGVSRRVSQRRAVGAALSRWQHAAAAKAWE